MSDRWSSFVDFANEMFPNSRRFTPEEQREYDACVDRFLEADDITIDETTTSGDAAHEEERE